MATIRAYVAISTGVISAFDVKTKFDFERFSEN